MPTATAGSRSESCRIVDGRSQEDAMSSATTDSWCSNNEVDVYRDTGSDTNGAGYGRLTPTATPEVELTGQVTED